MRTYFLISSIGVLIAGLCGAPLAWDGAGYLFTLLDKQQPFTPNSRLINIPIQWPVLFLSHFTNNMAVLRVVFSLMYTLIPLLALGLAWWIVRNEARSLFVWAALGVGLATLPGQFLFVSEATIALQLFWPVVLALLIKLPRRTVPVVLFLVLAIGFSHPDSIGLFAVAAGVAFIVGLRYRDQRLKMWLWTLGFGLITALFLARFMLQRTQYEGDQLSFAMLRWVFSVAVFGIPLLALLGILVATLAVFVAPWVAGREKREWVLGIYAVELLSLLGVGLALSTWASLPRLWVFANKFTFVAPFTSLFLVGVATLETVSHSPAGERLWRWTDDWPHRKRTAQMAATLFSVVLCVQSFTWFNLTKQVDQTLAHSSWGCLSMAPIWWLAKTPLTQLGASYYSVLLQGRQPQSVLLNGDDCAKTTLTENVALMLNQTFKRSQGWFDFQPLAKRLVAEQTNPGDCWFTLSSGWYQTETDSEEGWWRWSDGRAAQVQVFLAKAERLSLTGKIQSVQQPNMVDLLINGQKQATVAVQWTDLQPFTPIALNFKAGENVVQLVSHHPPLSDGNRPIAIGVSGITLASDPSHEACVMHP